MSLLRILVFVSVLLGDDRHTGVERGCLLRYCVQLRKPSRVCVGEGSLLEISMQRVYLPIQKCTAQTESDLDFSSTV